MTQLCPLYFISKIEADCKCNTTQEVVVKQTARHYISG